MSKSQKATSGHNKPGKTAGMELNETQLDQASGGIIAVLKPAGLVPAVKPLVPAVQ